MDRKEGEIEAVVGDVIDRGNRPYVVTYPKEVSTAIQEGETVTFSLTDWKGGKNPECGQLVILTGLQEFERGWRASEARPITL